MMVARRFVIIMLVMVTMVCMMVSFQEFKAPFQMLIQLLELLQQRHLQASGVQGFNVVACQDLDTLQLPADLSHQLLGVEVYVIFQMVQKVVEVLLQVIYLLAEPVVEVCAPHNYMSVHEAEELLDRLHAV